LRRVTPISDDLAERAWVEVLPGGEERRYVPVDDGPAVEEVGDEFDVEWGHDGAAPVVEEHEPLALKHEQSLANGQAGYSQLGGQVILGDLAAGDESTIENRGANLVRDVEDYRFPFDCFHPSADHSGTKPRREILPFAA